MKKAEIIIGVLALISFVLNLLLIPGGDVFLVLTMGSLSALYMGFGFALFNGIGLRRIFKSDSYNGITKSRIIGAIGAGLALAMTINGLLFKFQSWPGAIAELTFGLFGLLIVMIIGTIKYVRTQSEYYTSIFKRVSIYGGLGLLLMLLPKTALIEVKYRNHPAFLEALKQSINDPANEILQERVQQERAKMNGDISLNDTCFYNIHVPPDIDVPTTPHFDTTIVRNGNCLVQVLRLPSWGTETSYSLVTSDSSRIKQYKARPAHFFNQQHFGIIDISDLPSGDYNMHLMACGNGGFFTVKIK